MSDPTEVRADEKSTPSMAAVRLEQVTFSGLSFLLHKVGGLMLMSLGCCEDSGKGM